MADRYRLIRGKVHSTGADGYLASWFASRSRSGLLASFLHALTLGIALTTLFWSAFFGALVLLMDDLPKGGAVLMAGIFATFFACGWLALSSTFPPPDRRPCRRSPSHPRERSHEL